MTQPPVRTKNQSQQCRRSSDEKIAVQPVHGDGSAWGFADRLSCARVVGDQPLFDGHLLQREIPAISANRSAVTEEGLPVCPPHMDNSIQPVKGTDLGQQSQLLPVQRRDGLSEIVRRLVTTGNIAGRCHWFSRIFLCCQGDIQRVRALAYPIEIRYR